MQIPNRTQASELEMGKRRPAYVVQELQQNFFDAVLRRGRAKGIAQKILESAFENFYQNQCGCDGARRSRVLLQEKS